MLESGASMLAAWSLSAGLLALQAVPPTATPPSASASPPPAAAVPASATGWLVAGVGDSITYGTGTSNPPATSFLARAAGLAYASYVDLGVPAALTESIIGEVPSIPPAANVVVIYTGTNDVSAAADNRVDVATAIARTKYYEPAFDALVAAVRQRVPAARLVVVTVRDFGRVEKEAGLPKDRFDSDSRTAATREWNAHQRQVARSNGAAIVDLEYDRQWYVASEYGGAPGDVHPNDAGADRLARAVAPLLARH
jgi:lysophospholipase L1-like esterase